MENNNNSYMTIQEHLKDLRSCIFRVLVYILLGAIISYAYKETILRLLLKPFHRFGYSTFHFFSPYEIFFLYLKLILWSGICLACPFILWEIWRFFAPALLKDERKWVILSILPATLLFLSGMLFAYCFVFPLVLSFFSSLQTTVCQPMFSAMKTIQFLLGFLLGFGVMFMLPIILLSLNRFGVVRIDFLKKNRAKALILILVLSAICTPPDVISQILLAIPVYSLYELSILLMHFKN